MVVHFTCRFIAKSIEQNSGSFHMNFKSIKHGNDKGTLEICPGNTYDQTKHSDLAVMYRRRRRKNKHRIKDTKDFRDRSLFIIIAWGGQRLFLHGGGVT